MRPPAEGTASSGSCLSVVMPCYNELATINAIVDAVLAAPLVGELIIVDDYSTDGTRDVLAQLSDPRIRVILHHVNQGKGAALRTRVCGGDARLSDRARRRSRIRPS